MNAWRRDRRGLARSLRAAVVACATLAIAFASPTPAHAAPGGIEGTLDRSFGTSGTLTLPFAASFAASVSTDAQGRIVVSGAGVENETSFLFVVRYLGDGRLDPTFGTGGVARVENRPLDDPVMGGASAIGQGGRIMLVGSVVFSHVDGDRAVDCRRPARPVVQWFGLRGGAKGVDECGRRRLDRACGRRGRQRRGRPGVALPARRTHRRDVRQQAAPPGSTPASSRALPAWRPTPRTASWCRDRRTAPATSAGSLRAAIPIRPSRRTACGSSPCWLSSPPLPCSPTVASSRPGTRPRRRSSPTSRRTWRQCACSTTVHPTRRSATTVSQSCSPVGRCPSRSTWRVTGWLATPRRRRESAALSRGQPVPGGRAAVAGRSPGSRLRVLGRYLAPHRGAARPRHGNRGLGFVRVRARRNAVERRLRR